jgi:Fur family transcriptional regulator, ferric uptake regulator
MPASWWTCHSWKPQTSSAATTASRPFDVPAEASMVAHPANGIAASESTTAATVAIEARWHARMTSVTIVRMIPDVTHELSQPPAGSLRSGAVEPIVDDVVAARLRRTGQRFTDGRRALYEALARADRPVTIGEILRDEPRLAMSSTYRNLAILQQAGVVHRVTTDHEFARYELAEDLTDNHHHHLVCRSCGAVEDVEIPVALERSVRSKLDEVASESGFLMESHRVDALGLCARCRPKPST